MLLKRFLIDQLLCKSERIYTDLRRAKENFIETGDLDIQIIVREWHSIPIQYEFRGFVCKQQFTALSQYFHFCYFPELVEQKDEIEGRIRNYWEMIRDLIPHESYVIDFAILEDGSLKVIEINPFHYSTGAPFFGWKKDSEDRKILMEGPFEFRIGTEKPVGMKDQYMASCWIKYFKQKLNPPKDDDEWCPLL
eukprot:TRINITY_DN1248_c0_g1_i4.p1 TRINITY_DN1248_c0_g1~~TRINITY_DN1248_c0_g1_i4.p1  ORF type:complete len:193 (+),score=46.73 TRINITY_DN1248_c0_g1_i4:529-1107(+)